MAHVLLKHNEKAQQNTAVGMAFGGLITDVIAASAGPCYTAQLFVFTNRRRTQCRGMDGTHGRMGGIPLADTARTRQGAG